MSHTKTLSQPVLLTGHFFGINVQLQRSAPNITTLLTTSIMFVAHSLLKVATSLKCISFELFEYNTLDSRSVGRTQDIKHIETIRQLPPVQTFSF